MGGVIGIGPHVSFLCVIGVIGQLSLVPFRCGDKKSLPGRILARIQ